MSAEPKGGSFAPLLQPTFALLWFATVIGNIGSFMRDVASAWLVTDLGAGPAAVSLIQAAGTLPVFLLAIPAGVLADILDRRRFLLAVQVLLALVSLSLMALAETGAMSVAALVGLTFLGGIGAALMAPTWQAIVPELVPARDIRSAVALNSLGINIARAIGPAAGGLLLAAFGATITYGADVASYIVVIGALLLWRRPGGEDDPLSERFAGAFRAGLRYARSSRELHVVLVRAALFFVLGSAIWALLPLVARQVLGGDAGYYGLLLGAVGAGAILGAFLLPMARRHLDIDGLLFAASLLTALSMVLLALAPPRLLAPLVLVLLGIAWITALTGLNGTAQSILPNWVRGRALAVYLTVFNGAVTVGSLLWGAVAEGIGVPAALWVAAVALIAKALLLRRFPLPRGEADLSPSRHWPEPLLAAPVENDRGPVTILIEYRLAPGTASEFRSLAHRLSAARRRDGAYSWGLAEDAADPTRVIEWFMVESWAEHLRQHRRVSHADADLQGELRRFHIGQTPPEVRHFLSL
jgi:MFS family permease